MRLDALLLDFDGLILDTEPIEFAALSSTFASVRAELSFAEWHATVGSENPDWLARLARPGSHRYRQLQSEFEDHQTALLEHEPLRPGVRELFDSAARASVPVAVVTSGTRHRVRPELARHGLLDQLECLITADDVARTKPCPDPYRQALNRLDVEPAPSVAFEDSARGVAAAVTAGIRCVAVYNDTTKDQDFTRASMVCDRLDRIDLDVLFTNGLLSIVETDAADGRGGPEAQ